MNANYSFPRRQQAPIQPSDSSREHNASFTDDFRKSNALRASVLDAALQLGFGSDSKVAKWMFNEGDEDDDDEGLNSPGLTSASTAPSTGASDDAYLNPRTINPPSFTRDPTFSPFSPPVFPVKAAHIRRPSSDPFVHIMASDHGHDSDATFGKPNSKGRNKLVKKRSDGHLSDGGYLSESGPKKKVGKDLSKAERKELDKIVAQREKEEKKQRKAAKKAEKESGFTTGYDTDAVDATTVKKSKKKKSKHRQVSDGGYETDEGNQSSSSSKKPKSKFFRLGNRSKGDLEREEEPEIPPVPELPPIHPIADKFATTLSFDTIRSFSPTPASSVHSNQTSVTPSLDTPRTIQALANESSTTLSTLDAVPRPSVEPSISSEVTATLSSIEPSSRPASPYQATTPRTSDEEAVEPNKSPPKLLIPSPNYEPFIRRSPQGSPLRSSSRLGLPSRPVGLPASPRPSDAAQIHPGPLRLPIPPSPRSFESMASRSRLPTPVSPLRSETYLHPGSEPNGRASPSQFSVQASSEYIVPSPLPSPRGISQYGVPPPTPPPTAPLPPPPLLTSEHHGRSSPFAQQPVYPHISAGLEARVRSQRYNRNIYATPKRAVRSEDGHGPPPSASRSLERDRRHQSANGATTTMAPVAFSPEPDYDADSPYASPVDGMHDILARYRNPEVVRETGQALARNQSIKHLANPRTTDDDDESHYPEDEAGDEWRQSIMDSEKSQNAHDRLLDQITAAYDDSGRIVIPNSASPLAHRPHGLPAGGAKPGWI